MKLRSLVLGAVLMFGAIGTASADVYQCTKATEALPVAEIKAKNGDIPFSDRVTIVEEAYDSTTVRFGKNMDKVLNFTSMIPVDGSFISISGRLSLVRILKEGQIVYVLSQYDRSLDAPNLQFANAETAVILIGCNRVAQTI